VNIIRRAWDAQLGNLDSNSGRGRDFSPFHSIQTSSAAQPASYPVGGYQGALLLEVKVSEHEADHSPPSSGEIKNAWNYTFTPSFWHGA
jgi:hypothetical protein